MFDVNTTFVEHNHQNVQEIITKAFGLKIKLKKTEFMHKPPLRSHDISQDILVEDQVLTQVNKSKYIGSTVANNNNRLNAELDTRTLNASKSLGGD